MKPLLLAWITLCSADSATTHYALNTHRFHEAVMPFQNPWTADAVNAGQCVAVAWGSQKLPKKIGIPVLIVSIAARGWAVQHNIREVRR